MIDKSKSREELIKNKEDLEVKHKRYIHLLENAMDMIYRMSLPEGIYEYVSPASKQIFGYEPEVFYNSPTLIQESIHPDFKEYFQKEWRNLLNDKMPVRYEYKIIHKSGEERWLNQRNVLIKDDNGKPVAIEGIVTDITEWKKIELKLKQKNEEYEALNEEYTVQNEELKEKIEELGAVEEELRANNEELADLNGDLRKKERILKEAQKIAQLGHWELDIVNNKLDWSDEIYRIFDLEPQQFKATYEAFLESIHPDDREMVNKAYSDSLKNKTSYQIEHKLLLKGEKIKYVLEKCNTSFDNDGKPLRSIGTVQDITGRKTAQIKLENTVNELERSNKELEQFAYVASHDLQEPLRKVKNFTELFAKKYSGVVDEKANQYINYITTGADRMQTLVLDLLSLSRVSTKGKEFVPTDLNETVKKVVENLQLSIEEYQAQLVIDELPLLKVDESQMIQVFQNLIGNSIKFKSDIPPVIKISVEENNDNWEFSISDNGIGMDMKYKEKIFEVFQRLHTKEEYAGTGIGLAICKKIIERHKGTIWIESELRNLPAGRQGGSTFYFTIPKKLKNYD